MNRLMFSKFVIVDFPGPPQHLIRLATGWLTRHVHF